MKIQRLNLSETLLLVKILEGRKEELEKNPLTFTELARQVSPEIGKPVSVSSVRSICGELGIESSRGQGSEIDNRIADLLERIERIEERLGQQVCAEA